MSEDLSQLTPGQRVTVGVIAGMLTNEPAACAADVDNAIAATATVGAPEFARTRQERAEHIGAIQASGQQAIAETKPKVTRAEALEQVKTQLRALHPDKRHDASEKAYDQWSSETSREMLTEAYEEVIGRVLLHPGTS